MASINRELREALLSNVQKRKFRVQMLNASQKQLRASIENKLHIAHHTKSLINGTKKCCPKVKCTRKCTSDVLNEVFPFVRIMRRYNIRKNLIQDLVAGITVGIMHIPQGMAYGFLSQLPPIYGLYTSFFPVLLYFFFGSSRHVSVGTFAVISLMVGQVVNRGYHTHVGQHVLNEPNITRIAQPLLLNATMGGATGSKIEALDVHTSGYANPVKLGYAVSVTFVVGIFQLLLGSLRLGFMASFMSDPFISGFTTGASVHVFTSQIKHVFGIHVHPYYGPLALVHFYTEFFLNILQTNMVTFTASITCLLILVLIKEGINNNKQCQSQLLMPVPIELIVIAVSTIVSHYTKLDKDFGVTVVGEVPSGLPTPSVAGFKYIPDVLGDGLTIGFIAYAISFSMAKILADKHGYRVNANQELVALGVCNFVSSFYQSYCCSASLSRSLVQDTAGGKTQELIAYGLCNSVSSIMSSLVCVGSPKDSIVQDSVGGKTQLTGIFSALVVLVVLLYIGPMFESLPECILACIVIVTLKGMFLQFGDLGRLWRLSKKDFAVWLVTFIAVVVLDVALGLLIGIVFSLYFVLRHSQKPQMSELGQLPGSGAYQDVRTSTMVKDVDGMRIFRFETSIYFANAEHFRDKLYKKTGLVPRKLLKRKRKAMHDTLQRRKEELEMAAAARKRDLMQSRTRRHSIEIVTPRPVDEYEENLKKIAENKLILQRFSEAWQPPIKILIIDLSVVNYIDTVAVKQLSTIVTDYKEVGIKVLIAGCKPDVRNMLRNADFYKSVDYNCLYFTVHEAVVIGRELLDAENKKNQFKVEDVRLMTKMTSADTAKDKNSEAGSQISDDDDDDDIEDNDGDDNDRAGDRSSDEEWFDTSPDDTQLKVFKREYLNGPDGENNPNNSSRKWGSVPLESILTIGNGSGASKDVAKFELIPLNDN